jgi:hypothetical protein
MRIAVDGGGYGSGANALRGGNEMAALHHGTLTRKLAGFAGMAGDDFTSEEFAQRYDAAAQEAVDALDDVVDAFATLCGLAGQSHANHRSADAAAVYGHPAQHADRLDFVAGTVDVGSVRVASSLGANDSDLPAFWNDIMDHLEGYAWPGADTGRLRDAAATWRSAADDVERLTTYCDSAISRLETQDSPEIPLASQAVRDLQRAVVDLSSSMRSVGDACDEYAATVDQHRAIIRAIVADLVVEAGLTLAAGAVIGFFTVGGGAAVGGAIAGWRIASAARKILATLRALEALAKASAVARLTSVIEKVRPLRKVLERLKSAKQLRKREKAGNAGGKGPHHERPRKRGDQLDPATRPPTAGSDWEGHVARNGQGEVWQRPGAAYDCDSIRIQDPSARYPHGSVRFYNQYGQPIDLHGKPTGGPTTHIPINPDGTYPVPKGWNP